MTDLSLVISHLSFSIFALAGAVLLLNARVPARTSCLLPLTSWLSFARFFCISYTSRLPVLRSDRHSLIVTLSEASTPGFG